MWRVTKSMTVPPVYMPIMKAAAISALQAVLFSSTTLFSRTVQLGSGYDIHTDIIITVKRSTPNTTGITIERVSNGIIVPNLTLNSVIGNSGRGISLENTSNAVILYNDIQGNGGTGLYLNSSGTSFVHHNNISNEHTYELQNDSGAAVDARYNWWGDSATGQMDGGNNPKNIGRIHDIFDNGTKGSVDYSEWLSTVQIFTDEPVSHIIEPVDGLESKGTIVTITGIAAAPAGIDYVEISVDNGQSWQVATGKTRWSYSWDNPVDGDHILLSRVVDLDAGIEIPAEGRTIVVDSTITQVSGVLVSDETWSGQILLVGDVTIPAGVTLTIQPETQVKVAPLHDAEFSGTDSSKIELIVYGTLLVEATESETVSFSSNGYRGGQPGDWVGISVHGSLFGEFLVVEHAETPISFIGDSEGDRFSLKNSVIKNCTDQGLQLTGSGGRSYSVLVENNTITETGGDGIDLKVTNGSDMDIRICSNIFSLGGTNGIYADTGGGSGTNILTGALCDNSIFDYAATGINLYTSNINSISQLLVDNNSIHHVLTSLQAKYNRSSADSTLEIRNNKLHTGKIGILIRTDSASLAPKVINNEIHEYSMDGLRAELGSSAAMRPQIDGNQVYHNARYGISLQVSEAVSLTNNSLDDNFVASLYNNSTHAIDARGNWWGVDTLNEINSGVNPQNISAIYDVFDNAARGEVDYSDWLILYDQPGQPTLDAVISPTGQSVQILSGTKDAGSGIIINGVQRVAVSQETTWSYTLSLAEGKNSLTIKAKSPSGMVSPAVRVSITVDTTAPLLYSSAPADGAFVTREVRLVEMTILEQTTEIDTAATAQGTMVDGSGLVLPGSWAIENSHLTFTPDTPLQDGIYSLALQPTDQPLGNSTEATITFSVDLGPPAAPVIDTYLSPRSDSQIVISGTKEATSAVWVNGNEIVALSSAVVWSHTFFLAEGVNVFQAYCRDQAGNNSDITTFAVTLDTASPQFVSTVPADNSYTAIQPPDVRFTFNEATTKIDENATLASGDIFTSQGSPVEGIWSLQDGETVIFTPVQPFTEEQYALQVTARDIIGNANHASLTFTYDSTPPSVPTVAPVQSPTSFIQQILSGTKESNSSIRINSAGVIPVNEQTIWSHSVRLVEGDNNFVIDSMDKAGNISPAVSTMIHYDETAPLTVDTLIVNGEGGGTTIQFDWGGYNEAIQGDVAYYRIYLKNSLFTQVGTMTPVAIVPAGTFTYTAEGLVRNSLYYCAVIAVDDKENAHSSATPVSIRTRDIVAPEPVGSLTARAVSDTLTFSWLPSTNSADDLAGYLFSFNNEPAVALDSTVTLQQRTSLPDATAYPCSVVAVDGDGNRSEAVMVTGVTLLPNPAAVIITPYDGYVSISWNSVEPAEYVKQYAVYVSETPFTSITGKYHRLISRKNSAKVAWLTNTTEYYFAVATINISNGSKQEVISYPATPSDDRQGPAFGLITADGLVVTDSMNLTRAVEIRAEVTDPISVSRVEFTIDGILQSVDYLPDPEYGWFWDIQNFSDTGHSLVLVAYDSLGNSSEISFTVNIQLAPPEPPVFTAPAAAYLTNKVALRVAGEADPDTTVAITSNGSEVAAGIVVGSDGRFSAEIILVEGENRLVVRALNRAGASAPSVEHLVTLDTSMPDAPAGLSAMPKAGGQIRLDWMSLKGEEVTGYNVFRSSSEFSLIEQGDKLNNEPVKDTDYTDLTPEDGIWFYRVTTVDLAGNEGMVSEMVNATADRAPPKALAVAAHSYGKTDGNRIGPGLVDLTVILSEPLQAAPFVSVIPEGGTPYALHMQQKDSVTWQGSYTVADTTPSGTVYILFSGRDIAGNRGTDIESGATLFFDTDGPEVVRLQVAPMSPINNDDEQEIRVVLGLAEHVKPESVPILSYRLSAPGREITFIDSLIRTIPQSGEVEAWQGIFTLQSDAGLDGAETLSFLFEGRDDLENVSTKIFAYNQFQIYQGSLPPLATPLGLSASAMPEGKVALTWEPVEGAIGYLLYRKRQGETEIQPLARLTDMIYEDQPAVEDLWFYSVSSIREVGGVEAESGQSAIVSVQTDATAPLPPRSLILQLTPQGIMLEWQGEAAGGNLTYSLYRSDATEIISVVGLVPLVTGIGQTMVIDPTPSPTDHCYVITAVDGVGNESLPSNSAYQNFGLLPVSEISIVQNEAHQPVLSWSHPNNAKLSGYNISLQRPGGDVQLVTSPPLSATSYVDSSYTGDERTYIINAVDENGVISLGRSLFMPMLRTELLPNEKLERGIMNALTFRVKNLGREDVAAVWLEVAVGGETHISEKFDLQSGEYSLIPVIIGGYDSLPDLAEISITTIISPNSGETVRLIRSAYVDVSDGMLVLQFGNEEFVRGVTGSVWFRLENSGDEEIEIITATQGGNADSTELRYQLVDGDANILVTAPFKQVGTENLVTLPNGNVVARIQGGDSFTSQPVIIEIPSGVPDELSVRLIIDTVSYHQGQEDEVVMQGLTGEFPILLADTSYYGTITSISPEASFGEQDVIITGQAIERDSSDPLGLVPLKLVLSLEGFERTMEVMTDENGLFRYTFTPLAGESGRYQVRAVHPDLLDKPVQGEFVIQRVIVRPTTVNLSIPRNYEQSFFVGTSTGTGTSLSNLQLLYLPEDQDGGILPEGVNLNPGTVVPYVGEQSTVRLEVLLWANNRAADSGRLKLRLVSEGSDQDGWGVITVNTTFSTASPVLTFSPNHIETGVVQDDMVTENITLGNTGLAALENVRISLKTLEGFVAPSWLHLGIKPDVGDIEVGEERDIPVSFSPGQDIVPGPYQFKLLVKSDNFSDTDIYLFVIVNQDGEGNILFKTSDIYTGTLNSEGERIEGLAGAAIILQNEATLVAESVRKTDGLGEVEFTDLPAGWYKYRITATDHQEQIGRIVIKPGLTAGEDIFLDYNLVTVSWEVKEITLEDKYEIVLTATFETDVPAAVVVAEPASLTLPELKAGMVYNGEFTLTNYGIIRADDLGFELPADDANFRYELLDGMPDSLAAGESITVAYRVTCLKGLEQEDGSGGGCYTYNRCITIPYTYTCANDVRTSSRTGYCWTYSYGVCSGSSVSSGTGGGSWATISFSSPGTYTASSPVPLPQKLAGEKCLGTCNCKPATPPSCPTGVCPLPENYVKVGSIVDTRLREYSRDIKDLTVSIPGAALSVHRYYELGQWLWKFNRDNLSFESNSRGVVESVIKNGVIYENSDGAPDLFRFKSELIVLMESGYRWSDRVGNWMEYDAAGRLLTYGLRNDIIARVLYEGETFIGWADRNDNQVLWYGYQGGELVSVSDVNGRRVEYGYSGGFLQTVKNLRGFITTYSYANDRLIRVEEPGGKVRNIGYNTYGDVISVLNDEGVGHSFEYDYDKGTREYYVYTQYPGGRVREVWYNYDGDVVRVDINGFTVKSIKYGSRVKWITDERGYTSRYDLDEWDNEIFTLYPDDSWVEKNYSRPWNLLTSVNRTGVITEYEYDENGWRTALIEARGTDVERRIEFINNDSGKVVLSTIKGGVGEIDATTRFSYDEYDRLLAITDPENRVTTFSDFDEGSNPQTVEDGRGIRKYFTYDAAGNLLTIRDHDNRLVGENRYDEAGNRSSVLNAYLKEYNLVYDDENELTEIEDPMGNRSFRGYSPAGNLTSLTDREGNSTTYEYDLFDRVTRVIDPEGNIIISSYGDTGGCSSCSGGVDLVTSLIYPTFTRKMSYDSRKRLISQKDIYDSRERLTRYSYDEFGNILQVIDPEGNSTVYEYDDLGRKVSETDSQGNVIHFGYDSRDNLVTLQDGNGNLTRFEYDLSNRLVKEIKPLLQETVYSYDGAGNLTAVIDANGRKTVYTYDNNNRLVESEVYGNADDTVPGKSVAYSYNDVGSLTGYDDSVTSATYIYDDLQRRTGETVNYGTFSLTHEYSYYANGWKKQYSDPAGRIETYGYDKAGKPLGLDLGSAGQVSYNGYNWSRPSRITLPGGAALNFKYNGLQQVTAINGRDPAENPVIDYGYRYSAGGKIIEKSTGYGDYRYGYDSLYRLTGVNGSDAKESFAYDSLANRISSTDYTDWNYNSNNQLTGYGVTAFQYDNHGNMVERTVAGQKNGFDYSVDNRLEKITDNSGATVGAYYYDPFGRRLWKDVAGNRTYFHYNDEGLAGEYDAGGNELRTYGWQPGSAWSTNPLFVQIEDVYYWYQNDHLGTPQKIIAGNGALVWQGMQDAFGRLDITVEDITNNLRFPGLYYNWHRYYDPQIGRYISIDPIGLDGGINLYAYVGGNPLMSIDPFGLKAECCPNEKVSVWVCKGKLGGDDSSIRQSGVISHSYISCVDPATIDLSDPLPPLFGKHPRKFGEKGSSVFGPGYINREVDRNVLKAKCKKMIICPEDKERMCQEGPSLHSYNLLTLNCHIWANNINIPPGEDEI